LVTDTATPPRTPPINRGEGLALIWRQLTRARREFTLGGIGTLLFALATVASSFVIGWVTDDLLIPAVESGDLTLAAQAAAAGAILGVAGIRAAGIALRRFGAYLAQYRLQARDRTEVTDRYLTLPLEWHRRHPTGQLLSNVNADVEAASNIAAPLPMALGVVIMLVVTGGLLVMTDPFLASVGLAVLPAIALTNLAFQRRMRIVTTEAQRLRAQVSEIAHESFDAALVVKTLGREDAEVGRFGASSDELRDRMVDVGRLRAIFDPLMEALPSLGTLAVLAVGAWRVDAGVISAGTLVTFAYLFRLVALPMRVFAWLLLQLPAAVAGWRRVDSVLQEKARVNYGAAVPASTGAASAQVVDIAYTYPDDASADLAAGATDATGKTASPAGTNGDRPIEGRGVESIAFDVPAGSTVAIVGPTGSGKSTIAQLLVRLFDPDTGCISLDGSHLQAVDRDAVASQTAIVFQEAFLFDDTIAANITLGAGFDSADITNAARLAQADKFIDALPAGYHTKVGERGASLSGGQRQRIALARALIRRPRLLVLDDATSAVDPAVEAAILDELADLDTSVVIVAYRRSSILLADTVIYVEDGRVVGRGTHQHLYRTVPAYAELIDAYEVEAAS
jgi:ABC-type multidrug transport system fused ATPase/permease subunit